MNRRFRAELMFEARALVGVVVLACWGGLWVVIWVLVLGSGARG